MEEYYQMLYWREVVQAGVVLVGIALISLVYLVSYLVDKYKEHKKRKAKEYEDFYGVPKK